MNVPAPPAATAPTRLVDDLLSQGGELEETHISWVVLRDEGAWKIKKPVSLGFLDFSTVEKRRLACEAEVDLNQRLAPGIYRGCVPITREPSGRHRFGGMGEAVDWAVHMVRLPRSDRADVRLAEGRLASGALERIARRLATFHAFARCDEATARHGALASIEANVRENFEQTRHLMEAFVSAEHAAEVESWQLRFLADHAAAFEERVAAGRVRDGHGDLRLEHVYLRDDGQIVVLDCIEFNQRFRFADICADIAFLAMDLTWHGHPELAERFLAAYARASDDFYLYPLIDFYESYRAFVRGKISALIATGSGAPVSVRDRAATDARRYFLLALASARRALLPPRVIAVGGWIAAGKSTVADRLAAALAAPAIDADRTRKSLLGVLPQEPMREAAWTGAYSPTVTGAVYAEMMRRADAVLRSGRTVILDASFRSRETRATARRLAVRHGAPFHFVECRASTETCRRRLHRRERSANVSDGRLAIFDDFVARWEPVEELPEPEHRVADTERPVADVVAETIEAIGARPVVAPQASRSRSARR